MKTKSPIAYYGGKANLAPEILLLVPQHVQYVEPFFGSGAVFFSKPKSKNEVINDINGDVTNFFFQIKSNFYELQRMIHGTLHSEIHYEKAKAMMKSPSEGTPVERAWAFWVATNLAFSHVIGGGFAFGETGCGRATKNKRLDFTEKFMHRMELCEIFNRNAVDIIKLKDSPNTFFYVDPPYVSSNCGHYDGYTMDNFLELLETLKNIKGKFLLSSYPEEILIDYRIACGWNAKDIVQTVLVTSKREETKLKTECLTFNYPHPSGQKSLFDHMETPVAEN